MQLAGDASTVMLASPRSLSYTLSMRMASGDVRAALMGSDIGMASPDASDTGLLPGARSYGPSGLLATPAGRGGSAAELGEVHAAMGRVDVAEAAMEALLSGRSFTSAPSSPGLVPLLQLGQLGARQDMQGGAAMWQQGDDASSSLSLSLPLAMHQAGGSTAGSSATGMAGASAPSAGQQGGTAGGAAVSQLTARLAAAQERLDAMLRSRPLNDVGPLLQALDLFW